MDMDTRKSIENLSNIYRKSIENLSKIYRKSIENLGIWVVSGVYLECIWVENLSKIYVSEVYPGCIGGVSGVYLGPYGDAIGQPTGGAEGADEGATAH